jgi:shikimate dehydrogenase
VSLPEDPVPPAVGSEPAVELSIPTRSALWPASTTQIAGVVGSPVRHSLSPTLHNAAYSKMGIDWCYLAFEVLPGTLGKAVSGAVALGLRGLSVTMPHKDAAARLATRHSRQVRRLGAANTLIFDQGEIRAESCDGDGLLDDLGYALGFDPAGRRCGVIGAGGAGRATVLALAEAGAAEIIVVNRTAARAWRSVALAPKIAHVGRAEELKNCDLVVQATPSGMSAPLELSTSQVARGSGLSGAQPWTHGPGPYGSQPTRQMTPHQAPSGSQRASQAGPSHKATQDSGEAPQSGDASVLGVVTASRADSLNGPSPDSSGSGLQDLEQSAAAVGSPGVTGAVVAGVDPDWFGVGQLVVDLIYYPALTPFLLKAERQGATVRGGLGMLVHQAARQIRLFTGLEAPLDAMWAAVSEQQPEPRGSKDIPF